MKKITRLKESHGVAIVEYILLLCLIAFIGIISLEQVGKEVSGTAMKAANALDGGGGSGGGSGGGGGEEEESGGFVPGGCGNQGQPPCP